MYSLTFLVLSLASFALATTQSTDCSCGFYDASTKQLYTESIIVYFNETDSVPSNFLAETYAHKKELGWTSTYREGASPDQVMVGNVSEPSWLENEVNPTSLELFCDPGTKEHLVVGGTLRSMRRDIEYGSFRASMRSPHPWAGGSALSMLLAYNDSDTIEIDFLNTDAADTAKVMNLVNGEYPDTDLGTNYTVIEAGSSDFAAVDPWDYMTVRFDWTKQYINFTINENMTRSIDAKHSSQTIPKLGMPLVFKHWSTGDKDYMMGPPSARSAANVAWVRAFFNSSSMTTEQHADFNDRCSVSSACNANDDTIRGSTDYTEAETLRWKEPAKDASLVERSVIVACVFGFFGVFVLGHAILTRWIPWRFLSYRYWTGKSEHGKVEMLEKERAKSAATLLDSGSSSQHSLDYLKMDKKGSVPMSLATTAVNSRAGSASGSRAPSPTRVYDNGVPDVPYTATRFNDSRDDLAGTATNSPVMPSTPKLAKSRTSTLPALFEDSDKPGFSTVGWEKNANGEADPFTDPHPAPYGRIKISEVASRTNSELSLNKGKGPAMAEPAHHHLPHFHLPSFPHHHDDGTVTTTSNFHSRNEDLDEKGARRDPVRMVSMIPNQGPKPPQDVKAPQNVRIDYLAGAVAFSCICVTFVHFCLTFLPGVASFDDAVDHSRSDYWAMRTIAPYLLTEIWIGPFFTTSARFLSARYLRSGKLSDIGNKTLLRAPRFIVPIMMIALAQYFLIEMGISGALEYLASITWSTWPYVGAYSNFGGYINAIIDLAYIQPNAAPAIVPHYFIGVLWTIPVQLQNSYVVFIGAVLVREIKTHWKRFAFYAFCIINSWYAFSWGAMFWSGLMLSDLSVTYKYKDYIQKRPFLHYPVCITAWILVFGATSVFLVSNDFGYNFLTHERNIHPDWDTGLPKGDTVNAGYPNYYEPRLNTLVLATSLQVIVELSTWVQKFLSMKFWQWIFPHIMTIYMIHGMIFWTLGAWLCITLSVAGLPYWANMLIVAPVCYGALAIIVEIITPLTDKTAKNACKNLWRWAQEEPVPKRPTLGSYQKSLILDRSGAIAAQPLPA